MTQQYITNDGLRIDAVNARELVGKLRRADFHRVRSNSAYMQEVSRRARIQRRGVRIPTDNPTEFVAGMIRAGFLKKVEDGLAD